MLRFSLLGLVAAATLCAQSPLTTTFANNNGGSIGGAVYFDLNVTATAITITGLDLNLAGTGSIEVYTTPGTRIGNQANPAAWTLVSTGAVTGAVAGGPSPVGITPFTLANGTYGVAFKTIGVSHAYTNGTGTNQNYATAEVALAAGEASNVSFTAPILTPRVVNARISYLVGTGVPLPPHGSVYNGFTRGFNFTAAADFDIRQLALPTDAFQAGDTAGYLVAINGAVVYRSVGNAGAVSPGLHVSTGDVVDVLGNWSPAAAGNFTAHNSYTGVAAPFASTIAGVPHTLNRSGWQWDIGDPTFVTNGSTGTLLVQPVGQMGRVLMTTEPGTVSAGNATLGQGCISISGSLREFFATSASFDLGGSAVTLLPNGGGGYTVTRLGTFRPVGSTGVPIIIPLGDDTEATIPFTTGSFPGWTGVTVCSNGFISKATGNGTGFTPNVNTMLNASQDAFWSWHDFNPSPASSGKVKIEQGPGVTVVTWDGVWDFGGASAASANTLQFQLYGTGIVTIFWGTMSGLGNAHLVGYSPGGPSPDPGNTDISAIGGGSIVLPGTELLPLTLTASNRPICGTTWNLNVSNVPPTGVIGVDVLGLSDPGINDLAFLGMPTCGLRASLDVLTAWVVIGPTHARSFPVPNQLPLLNVNVYATSAVFQTPPVNAFGAITSNGVRGTIGDL